MFRRHRLIATLSAALLAACASTPEEPLGPPAKEMIYAVTASHQLVQFNAGQPQKLTTRRALRSWQQASACWASTTGSRVASSLAWGKRAAVPHRHGKCHGHRRGALSRCQRGRHRVGL